MSQLADSSLSSAQNSAVKYQGRKTSRAGSEQRRRLILEAALRIVIREGVRGMRHRAVAVQRRLERLQLLGRLRAKREQNVSK